MLSNIYSRKPLGYHDSIPIFSSTDEYIENYKKISGDHLQSLQESGTNPFIPETVWLEMEKSTIELIENYSREGEMILDVGVGLGRLLSHFPRLKRYGNDISLGYLKEAQSRGVEVCFSKIEDLPYEQELFDIVVCTDVLEHVFNLNLAIEKILRTLKKEGVCIIRVPYKENLVGYFDAPYKFIHLRNFDEYSLRLFLVKVFDCEYLETRFGGYILSDVYLKCRIRFLKRFFELLVQASKKFNKELARRILVNLYNPVEINVVVRKK